MPYAMVPPGNRAVLIGSAAATGELGAFAPLEESTDEGALILLRLDFADYPSDEALAQLNQKCLDAGIPAWPGYDHIVYADTEGPSVYLAWQKGALWMPIIIGILVALILPPLLGSFIWWILPQEIKSLISGLINLGMMMLVMYLIMKMAPMLSPEKERPKKLEEASR